MRKFGFDLVEERDLQEVGGKARLWRHEKTGAELLSIINSDENKCFGANFCTPPADSTGVAHILEHSVLCGSAKYPVKEPFVELLKGSLQTFLNAFTFPDKTCYPVASANLRDFYNLIDVYLDAVFHPVISRDIFSQEGWHLEAESADGPWTYKGVVYNEMKGVYSSPDSILAEQSQQAVFPDNLYSLDSGGDPQRIPNLTYEAFCDFHRRYYHPGNCRFFFWGDDPEDRRLEMLDAVIKDYGPAEGVPTVSPQKRLEKPRCLERPYASSPGDTRALFTVNWLLGERGDVSQALKMEMLEHILEGLPGSPLRRTLMDSGLGEDTTGCGLETDLRQMYYSTGLKGIQPGDVDRAEALIMDTLRSLAENGIEPAAVEAAVNSIEFSYRENNSGRFPRGLAAMIQALSTWLYGGDPFAPLSWEEPLAKIKEALARGERIFENAIKRDFLDNQHRARVVLLPEPDLARRRDAAEAEAASHARDKADQEERLRMVEETKRLRAAQLEPDKPENLAKIPTLGIGDMPRENAVIPRAISHIPQPFLAHELPTGGVAYASLLLPVERLPRRLLPFVPLFARSLVEWGTASEDYSRLGMRIAAKTGGVGATPLTGLKLAGGQPFFYLALTGKAVYEKLPALFAIFRQVLLEPQTDHDIIMQRLGQMILEDKARLEYGLQAAGHAAAGTRLRARFTGEGAIAESMSGISQLWSLRGLAERMEKEPEKVIAEFAELRSLIISGAGAICDCVAENSALAVVEAEAKSLLAALPEKPAPAAGEAINAWPPMKDLPAGEAFVTPGLVNYVGKAANLYDLGYKYHGSANVIMRWLRMGRLWEDVRVAGGAYGVFCALDRIGGTMVCSSYRDPNVDATIAAYDGLGGYLRGFTPTRAQLAQAIVGAIGDMDLYMLPDAKGAKSLAWWLSGQTDEMRQETREQILGTTAADFRAFADVLDAAAKAGAVCVLGGAGTAAAAREHEWKEYKLL